MRERIAAGAVLALAATLAAGPARADEDRALCREAFQQSQALRDDGKLLSARQRLVQCTRVCPTAFQKPCEQWLEEVEANIPTVVLFASDDHGRDLVDVVVAIDGARVTEHLDGKSIAVDPGPHRVRFEVKGKPDATAEEQIVARQGEKNRIVRAVLARPVAPTTEAPATSRKVPVAAIVAGGLGVLALGGFAYFGLKGNADHDALVEGCSKTRSCTQDEKDGVVRSWLVADVFLAAAVVGLGIGTYLWVTETRRGPTSARLEVRPSRRSAGASAVLRVDF